ncbi:ead/Ea22-like family protein [Raoultella ornithinolytica]|uniref:ead/Ea22-like family protein n=1 Tax=Raoultella ornithinolytica TaxID=54291 RepID=UPI00366E75F3
MTDITELAQSLKAAAENAIGAHERLAAYPYGEIIDISQHEGEQIDIDITDLNEFNKEANPVNILELVEALEKAQGMEAYWKTQCRGITDHCEELQARIAELESRTVTAAAADVLAERQRQVTAEGWTAERDDGYQNSELADAAACYAIHAHNQGFSTPAHWPWSQDWWKQTSPRRDLVKAGALILAEIERLDRAAGIKVEAE